MMQHLLTPLECTCCGNEYTETGYWQDALYCLSCSMNIRRQEEEKKKELARHAADIAEKYGLDLDQYASELPEEVRRQLNPKNAGRKSVKYKDEYCELLIERAAEGKSEVEFAAEIHISQALITRWTEAHPRFRQAREIANDHRAAWIESHFRLAMLNRIPCQPSMCIRYASAKLGWGEKTESVVTGGGGEIPVVKIIERDTAFPSETLAPTVEQRNEAGLDGSGHLERAG